MEDPEHIGQDLIACLPEGEAGLGPGLIQELADGESDGTVISSLVKSGQSVEGGCHLFFFFRFELLADLAKGVKRALARPKKKERFIGQAKKVPA